MSHLPWIGGQRRAHPCSRRSAHDTVSAAPMGHSDAVSYAAWPCCGCGRLKSRGSTGVFPSDPTTTSRATIPSSQPGHSPRPWPCWRMCAGRRGNRVELTIGPGSSEAVVSPRPSHHLPVPSLVDRAAQSGVVPGKPGGAAVLGAGSGFAEGAHHRSGAGGAASAIAHRHSHACIVPPPKQGKRCSASPSPAGRGRCGRVGSVAACRVLLWCGAGCGGWAGLAGRGPKGSAPPGQVAGCRVPHEPARSAAVDPARAVAWR
jgi:hypothetical protein